jgi:GNAT superfamily N-acetyltransferase
MTIELRPGRPADLMAVGALHQRSRVAAYSSFLPRKALAGPSPRALGEYWTERWDHERTTHRLTVAERSGRLVGFTYLGPDDEEDPLTGLLCAIHLEPTQRGRGIGRRLMIDALGAMRVRGWRRAALWVLHQNTAARAFYERGGWRATGAERDEVIGTTVARQVRYACTLV